MKNLFFCDLTQFFLLKKKTRYVKAENGFKWLERPSSRKISGVGCEKRLILLYFVRFLKALNHEFRWFSEIRLILLIFCKKWHDSLHIIKKWFFSSRNRPFVTKKKFRFSYKTQLASSLSIYTNAKLNDTLRTGLKIFFWRWQQIFTKKHLAKDSNTPECF